jgi:signal transduction histidine kinase
VSARSSLVTPLPDHLLLQQVIARLPVAVVLVGSDDALRMVNGSALSLLKLGEPAPTDVAAFERITDLRLSHLLRELRQEDLDFLVRDVVWGESSAVHLRVDVSRLRDESGVELGILVALRDVTQSRRLELEQAEFVSTVSHELKTPLTTMRTVVELLRTEDAGTVTEEQAHFLEMALRNVERLEGLIRKLLDVGRAAAGRLQLSRTESDVRELLDEALDGLARTARQQQQHLEYAIEEDARAYVDAVRFPEIVENLVGNALKFTGPQGRVHVEVSARVPCPDARTKRLTALLGREVLGVQLVICDDGPGMDREATEKAFQRFYQAGDPLADRPEGVGLGLSITRALVKAHEGCVELRSAPGEGTQAWVWIPDTAAGGALAGAAIQLDDALEDARRHLRPGWLLAVGLGPDPEAGFASLRAFLAERNVDGTVVRPVPQVAFLVLTKAPGVEEALASLEASLRRRAGWSLGEARFPADGTRSGTLLALAWRRCGVASAPVA